MTRSAGFGGRAGFSTADSHAGLANSKPPFASRQQGVSAGGSAAKLSPDGARCAEENAELPMTASAISVIATIVDPNKNYQEHLGAAKNFTILKHDARFLAPSEVSAGERRCVLCGNRGFA